MTRRASAQKRSPSHPSSKDRLSWARALSIVSAPRPGDDEPVWSLFESREELERRMTSQVKQNVAENHGVMIPDATAA